jgi:hypothetical protein
MVNGYIAFNLQAVEGMYLNFRYDFTSCSTDGGCQNDDDHVLVLLF